MILRRLSLAISRQDWFVVVLEVLIVVVGIFLGLQMDDWNQQRKDRADERVFLQRLHNDLQTAEELSARVRQRRLSRHQIIIEANDVIFSRAGRDELTDQECISIGSSNNYNINVSGFSSLDELVSTGRLGIISNRDLRAALIRLQQTRDALANMVTLQASSAAFESLPVNFPELIQLTSYLDPADNEIRAHHVCDLQGMRANQRFLNQWSANADGYDAYVKDGLKPWLEQFEKVHALLDTQLGLDHS